MKSRAYQPRSGSFPFFVLSLVPRMYQYCDTPGQFPRARIPRYVPNAVSSFPGCARQMPELPLKAAILPVTPFRQNCSLVWCTRTMKGAFIDPGGETDRLLAVARGQNVTIEKILLTHGHLDHAGG